MIAILFVFISGFIFQYVSWRRLDGEYQDRKVLMKYLWLAPTLFLISSRMAQVVFSWNLWELRLLDIFGFWRKPGFDLLGGIVFLTIYTMFFAYQHRLRVWPFLEDLWFSFWLYIVMWIAFLGYSGLIQIRLLGILMANMLFVLTLNLVLTKRYRSLSVYPSGKKGFLFWFSLGVLGMGIGGGMAYFREGNLLVALGLGVVSLAGWFGLYFLGKME